jgi:hypothetical protein
MKSLSILSLLSLLAVAGCSNDVVAPTPTYALGEPIPIRFGQQVSIPDAGFDLWFSRVQDGRCPQPMLCLVATPAIVRLVVLPEGAGGVPLDLEIGGAVDNSTVTFHEFTIHLTNLTPYPTVEHMPAASEYVATVVVTQP